LIVMGNHSAVSGGFPGHRSRGFGGNSPLSS
jgi:hypothetical protein